MEKLKSLIQLYTKYLAEAILILLSILVIIASTILYVVNIHAATPEKNIANVEFKKSDPISDKINTIFIDVTGSVMKPDSYEVPAGSRLKDVLNKAGGLSELADKDFFYRNFNLSKVLSDQEKIYIPSVVEVSSGIFKEEYRIIELPYSSNNGSTTSNADVAGSSNESSTKVHINSASSQDLDGLPGIGAATVQKIIDNRPYSQSDDLVNKKVVGSAVYGKIKDLIDL